MNTKETLAALLTGREIGDEITREEAAKAKADGLVVVYGYSDDNVEFAGAIDDEIGCCDGGTIEISKLGTIVPAWGRLEEKTKEDALSWFRATEAGTVKIEAIWGQGGYSWTFAAPFPVAYFDILEGDEKFCRGIVFSLADIK